MEATVLVALVAAFLAAGGTAFAALQSRKSSVASVDVRVFANLQGEVLALQQRLNEMRALLYTAQDGLDAERSLRRECQGRITTLEDTVAKLVAKMGGTA